MIRALHPSLFIHLSYGGCSQVLANIHVSACDNQGWSNTCPNALHSQAHHHNQINRPYLAASTRLWPSVAPSPQAPALTGRAQIRQYPRVSLQTHHWPAFSVVVHQLVGFIVLANCFPSSIQPKDHFSRRDGPTQRRLHPQAQQAQCMHPTSFAIILADTILMRLSIIVHSFARRTLARARAECTCLTVFLLQPFTTIVSTTNSIVKCLCLRSSPPVCPEAVAQRIGSTEARIAHFHRSRQDSPGCCDTQDHHR